jgi:hypothetical protein
MGESHRDERQYIDVLAGPQRGTVSTIRANAVIGTCRLSAATQDSKASRPERRGTE